MEIKGNGRGCPKGPYHKPPKPLSTNTQNQQNHKKRANLMEINRNGRGCPRETLPKTTKTIKQNQPKQAKTLANLMEIKGNGRGWPKVPYHKPPQPLSKNRHNHQNHPKRANLMEINRNGEGCHQRTLPTTAKTTRQKQPKQAKTLANLMEIKGNGGDAPGGPTTNHQSH
jgi:predicted metal-binding protein